MSRSAKERDKNINIHRHVPGTNPHTGDLAEGERKQFPLGGGKERKHEEPEALCG